MEATKMLLPYKSVPVLVYHRIGALCSADNHGLTVTPEQFKSHLRYLCDHGVTPITVDQLYEIETESCRSSQKYVAITFDDGYLDNYENAFPILQDFGFAATIFLISSLVGTTTPGKRKEPDRYLGWSHAREMQACGISFQSHTHTHRDLTKIDAAQARMELTDSRRIIEDALGKPVRHLAYPYGFYNREVMEMTGEAGYLSAYAAGDSPNGAFSKERFDAPDLDVGFPFLFRLVASGWGSYVRSMRDALLSVVPQ